MQLGFLTVKLFPFGATSGIEGLGPIGNSDRPSFEGDTKAKFWLGSAPNNFLAASATLFFGDATRKLRRGDAVVDASDSLTGVANLTDFCGVASFAGVWKQPEDDSMEFSGTRSHRIKTELPTQIYHKNGRCAKNRIYVLQ